MTLPAPVLKEHEGFLVVRDDLIEGGTKIRALHKILPKLDADEFVYPSSVEGLGPVALAHACRDFGKKATLIYSWRKAMVPYLKAAFNAGANILTTDKAAFYDVVKHRAQSYANGEDVNLLPFSLNGARVDANRRIYLQPGFKSDLFHQALVEVAKDMDINPREVWAPAGSGNLTRALQEAWPDADHHAVIVNKKTPDIGWATLHRSEEEFNKKAQYPPPYPSAIKYDAKIWTFVKQHAKPGALVWNVGV